MNALSSKLLRNPVAHASIGAGVLLCLLAAFVVFALDNRSGDVIEPPSSVSADLDAPLAGSLRESLATASDRVSQLGSWQPVLRWSAESSVLMLSSENEMRSEPLGSGRSQPITRLEAQPKSAAAIEDSEQQASSDDQRGEAPRAVADTP